MPSRPTCCDDWSPETDLRAWQQLYARAERAARFFFAEHFGDLCAQCFAAAQERRDPSFQCCQRTNFFLELISSPLLEGLAEESLGHSLLVLSGPNNTRGCAALGPTGCRIPFGRPEICNAYICEHLYRAAFHALPGGMLYQIQTALEIFDEIEKAPRHTREEYQRCSLRVEALEALLDEASQHLRERADAFTEGKAEAIFDLFPPRGSGAA